MSLHHTYQLRKKPIAQLIKIRQDLKEGHVEHLSTFEIDELLGEFTLVRYVDKKKGALYLVRKVATESTDRLFQEYALKERLKEIHE